MTMKEEIARIAQLSQRDIGSTEENVKQKVMVPLLEALGHSRQNLEFEYGTRSGGRLDIYIKKNVPQDCTVLIDTKRYEEDLSKYVDQIRDYTFSESSLLSILVNGTEVWIYSPIRGVDFHRSMLYSIKRENLSKGPELEILNNLLSYENLKNKKVIEYISSRENEIKKVMTEEDEINEDFEKRIEGINEDLEGKRREIEELEKERTRLNENKEQRIAELWQTIGLPRAPFGLQRTVTQDGTIGSRDDSKARKVTLREAVDRNFLKDKQVLIFFHKKMYRDETAEINYEEDKLLYHGDNKLYSVSNLAKKIDKKVGLKHDNHGVAGPKYWMTENGKLLHDIYEEIRNMERK